MIFNSMKHIWSKFKGFLHLTKAIPERLFIAFYRPLTVVAVMFSQACGRILSQDRLVHMWQGEMCGCGGHVWPGGVHGRGLARGVYGREACMAGGCAWMGCLWQECMHGGKGGVNTWLGAFMQWRRDGYCSCMHPTGMHSCLKMLAQNRPNPLSFWYDRCHV